MTSNATASPSDLPSVNCPYTYTYAACVLASTPNQCSQPWINQYTLCAYCNGNTQPVDNAINFCASTRGITYLTNPANSSTFAASVSSLVGSSPTPYLYPTSTPVPYSYIPYSNASPSTSASGAYQTSSSGPSSLSPTVLPVVILVPAAAIITIAAYAFSYARKKRKLEEEQARRYSVAGYAYPPPAPIYGNHVYVYQQMPDIPPTIPMYYIRDPATEPPQGSMPTHTSPQ
ncbi:hypothetical protein BZG36_04402 [Bifiguratus adelaidae]|uniref:Uncharacterized protein n=1 Tax=Bifiguratus adelaidae TaxID=1938954 RepID=A0A261XVQ7_9FUNG|nr:hypothetical protein BZG36_04402 [Bifiguratus adelaidae]